MEDKQLGATVCLSCQQGCIRTSNSVPTISGAQDTWSPYTANTFSSSKLSLISKFYLK